MKLLKTIIESLDKVKARNINIYDMEGISPLFDYMVIATIDSNRQADAATHYLKDDLAKEGFEVKNVEGKNSAWVLVDCYDVLVHVFTDEERAHYSLERIYMDVKQITVDEANNM